MPTSPLKEYTARHADASMTALSRAMRCTEPVEVAGARATAAVRAALPG